MALNTPQLQEDIVTIVTDMRTRTEVSDTEFANRLATAIETYVKTATIVYTTGLVAPSGGGAVTGTFTGQLE